MAATGPVGRQLDGSPKEHQTGNTILGLVREFSAEGGERFTHIVKGLRRGGISGAAIWGVDLGAVSCNIKKLEGVHVGLLWQVLGKKAIRQNDLSWRRAA